MSDLLQQGVILKTLRQRGISINRGTLQGLLEERMDPDGNCVVDSLHFRARGRAFDENQSGPNPLQHRWYQLQPGIDRDEAQARIIAAIERKERGDH